MNRHTDHNTLSRKWRTALSVWRTATYALLFTVLSTIASCSMMDTDTTGCDKGNDNTGADNGNIHLSMTVMIENEDETASRANNTIGPKGEDDGDGNVNAFESEYKVENATLLIYQCGNDEMKLYDDKTGKPVETHYFDSFTQVKSSSDDSEVTNPQPLKNAYYKSAEQVLPQSTKIGDNKTDYRCLIITNAGDVRSKYEAMTLQQAKDDILADVWSGAKPGVAVQYGENNVVTNFGKFVMTNDQSHGFSGDNFKGKGTKENPYVIFEKILRAGARIDFVVLNNNNSEKKGDTKAIDDYDNYVYDEASKTARYIYPVKEDNNVKGYFVLTHVLPFNCQKQGTYFLKRTSDKATDITKTDLGYLNNAVEKVDGNLADTNYILDPYWTDKVKGTDISSYYNNYLSTANISQAGLIEKFNNWDSYKVKPSIGEAEVPKANQADTKKTGYYVVTYTQENTTPDNSLAYATGLLLRGTYYPLDQWKTSSGSTLVEPLTLIDNAKGKEKVFRYYIRHSDPLNKFNQSGVHSDVSSATAMTFGIVRNNIYRVSIERVEISDQQELTITPKIQVRKWAKYTHSELTM